MTTKKLLTKKVYLNIYDLSSLNCILSRLGLGAYHSSVEFLGKEYSYGLFDGKPSSVRVFYEPRANQNLKFRESVFIGEANLSCKQINHIFKELTEKYSKAKYDIFHTNCHSYSQELCLRLTGKSIPRYVYRICEKLSCLRTFLSQESIHGSDFQKLMKSPSSNEASITKSDRSSVKAPKKVKLKRIIATSIKICNLSEKYQIRPLYQAKILEDKADFSKRKLSALVKTENFSCEQLTEN